MKAIITATLLLTLTTIVFCQEPKLIIGVAGSPSFYTIKSTKGSNHKYTYNNPCYRVGIDLSFHFSKKSVITTGLFYFSIGYKVNYAYIFLQPGDPYIPRNSDITAGYLDIPAIYNFIIVSQEKFVVYNAIGIISSILILSDDKTTFEDNSIRSSGYLNSSLLSLQLSTGLQYSLNERFGIKIEPQYRLFLKGIDKFMNQTPTAINGTVGIVYNLKAK